MEDTLEVISKLQPKLGIAVLILVLMEDTLEAERQCLMGSAPQNSLNPCFNGRYPRG